MVGVNFLGSGKKHVSRLFTEPQTRSLEWKLGGVSKNLGAYGKRGAGFARELGLGKAAERLPWATTGHCRSSVTSRPRTREASGQPPAPGQASRRRGRSPAPRPALAVLRLDLGSHGCSAVGPVLSVSRPGRPGRETEFAIDPEGKEAALRPPPAGVTLDSGSLSPT